MRSAAPSAVDRVPVFIAKLPPQAKEKDHATSYPAAAGILPELAELLETSTSRTGFLPNSQLIIILRGFVHLASAINGPGSTIEPQLRNLVSQMASRASGCGYCMAHTAGRVGISDAKEEALWEYETSPLFSDAERADLARRAGRSPSAECGDGYRFAELKRH